MGAVTSPSTLTTSFNMKAIALIVLVCSAMVPVTAQPTKKPVPTTHQLKWHDQEYYWFIHFGPNTFTDKEWGHGDEPEDIFNPTNLDCRQWARIAKQSGARGIIITAKHHDGFCLWPSKYSMHTVRESKWRNGKGDVLKELSAACKEYGLKFGVYISPWDRNHPLYGTPGYNNVFVDMMKEIFANYGPIWELWWDGANGEGPNGKRQVYDWNRFEKTVRQLSPSTVVFSDIGPDVRWVGNEKGIAGKTNWNTIDTAGFLRGEGAPPTDTLNQGNVNGKVWVPAECDVSIRPGWFYHANEDDKVKSAEVLFDLYLKSVGRGANFLLNIPPDRRGRIHENDSIALVGFHRLRTQNFSNNLLKSTQARVSVASTAKRNQNAKLVIDGNAETHIEVQPGDSINISLPSKTKINSIVLGEAIKFGQQAIRGKLILRNTNQVAREVNFSTIGRKRILTFPATDANQVSITVEQGKGPILLSEIQAFLIQENLIEK